MPRDREQEQIRAVLEQVESEDCVQGGLTGDVHIVVEAGALLITMPGTNFSVTYRKQPDAPWLVSSDIIDDREAAIKRAEFLARAWNAANDKARELGWIV